MKYASRTSHLKPEGAYQVLARAQELEARGQEIIHLEIGQPDFETFDNIRLAGIRAISEGHTRYTPPIGMKSLREVIAEDAGKRHGLQFHPDQVVVSPGAKPNLFFPALALIEPGDEVIYPDPGFPTYEAMIRLAGGIPVPVPLKEENGFSFDLDAFHQLAGERTRLVILNSPSNPTGGVMPLADLKEIATAAHKFDFWVMSDEIYSRVAYDHAEIPSIASLPGMMDRTVIVDGFSKTYAMTGWRVGYVVAHREIMAVIRKVNLYTITHVNSIAQRAAVAAITGPQDCVNEMVQEFKRRGETLAKGLNATGKISCMPPEGAFFLFANITRLNMKSEDFVMRMIKEAGVSAVNGSSFGSSGEGYVRFCFANSLDHIRRAVVRIEKFVKTLK